MIGVRGAIIRGGDYMFLALSTVSAPATTMAGYFELWVGINESLLS